MKSSDLREINRRGFLKGATCSGLGIGGLGALTQLRLLNSAVAQTPLTDYKALVCVYMNGGNDSFNMVFPTGGAIRTTYSALRGVLGLPTAGSHALSPIAPAPAFQQYHGGTASPMAMHPSCAAMARMFNEEDLSVIFNVGTLVEPLANRTEFNNVLKKKPINLLSHSDQSVQWQTSLANEVGASSGWGGRLAELVNGAFNANSVGVSMNISIDNLNSFQVGASGEVIQYIVGRGGAEPLDNFGDATGPYGAAMNAGGTFANPSYKTNVQGRTLRAFDEMTRLQSKPLFEREYDRVIARSRTSEAIISAASSGAAAAIDAVAGKAVAERLNFVESLAQVAKLIAGRNTLANRRQIFYIKIEGYDTHSGHIPAHARLMTELSEGLGLFREMLQLPAVNAWNNTVAFTASDFGRGLATNGGQRETAGSDHAWAGHSVVCGGPVKGKRFFGDYPDIRTPSQGGVLDIGRSYFIPTTSVDQYSAVLARWFGADANALQTILPNLSNFEDPFSAGANLGFI